MVRAERSEQFEVTDWREIHSLYPNQWVAIEVEEISPGVGITRGKIIARGKREHRVMRELDRFIELHPDTHIALFNTGPMIKRGLDFILASD